MAFIILKELDSDVSEIRKSIVHKIATDIAKFAIPANIYFVPGLPKTRSGKLMRRMLRTIATGGENFGDTSTLLDPSILKSIQSVVNQ